MAEGQAPDATRGKDGRKNMMVIAAVAVTAIVVVAAILLSGAGGSKDFDKVITRSNAEVVLDLSDLSESWSVDIPYRPDPDAAAPNITDVGVARYMHNISADPLKVEIVTLMLYHLNTTELAKELFAEYMAQGVHSWQSIDLETVGNVSVGDEAVLCSGNWTGSHGAIKTLVFRENNIIVLLVYEATENVGLSNEAAIEMAQKQDTKILA
jgi:hypothetical protein